MTQARSGPVEAGAIPAAFQRAEFRSSEAWWAPP